MSQEIERIKSKIQKLLNLAEKASNEHEAASAMAKARALMDKYQLSQLDAMDFGGESVMFTKVLATRFFAAMPEYLRFLPTAVAQFNDCQAMLVRGEVTYKKKPGDALKWGLAVEFRGMVDDVNLAVEMFTRLLGTVNRLCSEYFESKGITGKYPVGLGNKYKSGAIIALCNRLEEYRKERESEMASSGTGLMVIKGAAVAEYFGNVEYKSKVPNSTKGLKGEEKEAFFKGVQDGESMAINGEDAIESK